MTKKYKGLSTKEVFAAREKYGSNMLVRLPQKGLIRRFFENLGDPIIRILLIALILEVIFTFGNCNLIEVFGIVAAILIATVVSTVSEYGSERAFRKMEAENSESYVNVIRNGKISRLRAEDIVVGDIVLLSAGEKIEADGILIEGEVTVDQSALNGENRDVTKNTQKSGKTWDLADKGRVFRGSLVTGGSAVMRVARVGGDTFYGMVARDVQTETRISPLKLRLSKLASQISKIGYVVAGIVGLSYIFNTVVADNLYNPDMIIESLRSPGFIFSTLIHTLTLMITVIVVAVPEGLPMMITVVLSANMKRMIKDNILVKKLVGIETAGSLNILFTDKTGTITEGRLSVDRIITSDKLYRTAEGLLSDSAVYQALLISSRYNTMAEVGDSGIVGGNATERAIGAFFSGCDAPDLQIREKTPFSSAKKYSSVTMADGSYFIKGAPEIVLDGCRYCLGADGRYVASDMALVKDRYRESISHGERVIAVAVARGVGEPLAFVALIVLKDKIREGVCESVRSVMRAGIQIVMVTGDNIDTATHIAAECGFYKAGAGHIALTSDRLSEMSDDEVKKVLPTLRVVARALPQDKMRLVRLSQELDMVAGMTGDGINDAPSLKLADVGFAMGSGTDIAKSAGDIVILDDSFKSISKTVLYGRTIFKSIRKFITFQLIMNLAACGITLLGPFLGVDTPITIIQMLWVNIIMDTLGGLAFAGEAPLDYYMHEKPKRRDEPILSRSALSHILLNGAFTLGLLAFFIRFDYFKSFYGAEGRGAQLTAFYALFIFAGLFNCLCARCERLWIFSNIGKNKLFLVILGFITVIQVLIVYFGGELFRSTPLSVGAFMLAVGVAALVLVFDCLRRIFTKLK